MIYNPNRYPVNLTSVLIFARLVVKDYTSTSEKGYNYIATILR